jgi:hypothetical protein
MFASLERFDGVARAWRRADVKKQDKDRARQQSKRSDQSRQHSQHMDRGHQAPSGMHGGEQPGQLGQAGGYAAGSPQQHQLSGKTKQPNQPNQPRIHRPQQR